MTPFSKAVPSHNHFSEHTFNSRDQCEWYKAPQTLKIGKEEKIGLLFDSIKPSLQS